MAQIGRLKIPSIAGGARSQQSAGRRLYGNRGSVTVVQTLEAARDKTPEETTRRNPFMLSPVWRLGLRLGSIPIKIYEFDANKDRQENQDHPAYPLLRHPNNVMSRNILIAGTVAAMFNKKEAFWLKTRPNPDAPPDALWPSPNIRPKRDDTGLISGFELVTKDGPPQPVRFEDVCWFRLMPNWEDWTESVVPMDSLGDVATFSNSALSAMTDMFDAGFLGRVYVNMHGKTLEQDVEVDDSTIATPAATGFLDRFSAQMSIARRDKFATPVMEDGATLDAMGGEPNDEVMIRALELTDRIVNRTFGFPQDGDLKTFYAEAIQPVADAIEQELERSLMSEWPNQPAFPEFQFRELLKGNETEVVESHARAILTGQETQNEARRDRNRRPLEGGDELLVPLNLAPSSMLTQTQERPPKDTQGGLGGGVNDGQDSTTSSEKEPVTQAAIGEAEVIQMRALVTNRWKIQRQRTISRQGDAFANRARGSLRKEAARVREVVTGKGIVRMREAGIPPRAELLGQVGAADPDLERYLNQFMNQTGDAAWQQAEDFIGAERRAVSSGLAESYAARAQAVTERFSLQRQGALNSLFEQSIEHHWTTPQLAEEVSKMYSGMATNIADGIARTETAFAHERAAMASWGQAGVTEMEYIDGGGPCSTGVCHDAVGTYRMGVDTTGDIGYSFEGAEAPPLHPSCTCFVVPAIPEAARGAEIAEAPPGTETPVDAIGSRIPEGPVEDVSRLGGGVTQTYTGRIGTYDVVVKPQSGLGNQIMRGGIPADADIGRELAAQIVNEELGGLVTMPAAEARLVDLGFEISEESRKFLGLAEGPEQSLVMEMVTQSRTVGEAGGFQTLTAEELHNVSLFDSIIGNMDRHSGNGLIDADGHFWAIDHGLAFPDPAGMASSAYGTSGNYWAQALTSGDALTAADVSRLNSLLSRQEEITERLMRVIGDDVKPFERNDWRRSVDAMFARVRWLSENAVLPEVQGARGQLEWLSSTS